MLEILVTPTKEDLEKLNSFLEAKFGVEFSDSDVLEAYYSFVHLGKAIYLFSKQQEAKK